MSLLSGLDVGSETYGDLHRLLHSVIWIYLIVLSVASETYSEIA